MNTKLNFYPGPSRVYDKIPIWTKQAFDTGILSINHRSLAFESLSKKIKQLFIEKLNLPSDYIIFFISSATEAWEIILQSLVAQKTLHIFNGAFGKKFANYADKIRGESSNIKLPFELEDVPKIATLGKINKTTIDTICLTHNETSNGTYLPNNFLKQVRNTFPKALITLDATSSMGGINIPWENIDLAYASVQKCFGLPAGLGIMIASPKVKTRASIINENNHYNSVLNLIKHSENFQTTHTPNILNIFLLSKVLTDTPNILTTDKKIRYHSKNIYEVFKNHSHFNYLINNETVQSPTVICITGNKESITSFKQLANKKDIILGNGYGDWKSNSFRIANFPAIPDHEWNQFFRFIKHTQNNLNN